MDKTYKHKAKSILESDDKQFISKSEKESFIDHIKNHPEEINKDDYYTKEEVNHIASSSISKDLGIVDTNPCSIINAEKHGYLPLPEEVMNLIGPNKEYQYWCLSQKVNGDKVCILTKINSIVDRVSFDVDGNIKLSTENDGEFSMFSLSQASNKNSWIVHNASIVTGGFFVIGSENIYSNYDLINKDTGEVIFKGKEMNHTLFQLARAEEATIRSYTGKTGELTVDLTNKTVVLQDGVTAGGISLAKEQEVNKVIADLDTHIKNHPRGFSGDYNDLTNKPNLEKFENHINNHPEGFSGDYNDLINKPNLKEFQDHIDNHPEIKDVDLSDYYNKKQIDDKLDLLPTLENFKNWGEIPTDEEACLYANTINYPPLPNDVGGRNAYPYWGIFYVPRYSDKHHLFVSTSKSIRVSKTMYELRWHVWGVSKCYTWTPGSSEWVNESIPSEMETGTDTSCYLKECNYYNLSGFSTIPNKGGDGHIVIRQARGTSDALDTYTGKEGELTVDTTNKILRIQDGVTKGGIPLAKKEDLSIFELKANKDQPNGYAGLDENGKIDINNLPDITQDCIGEDWGEITGITKPPMPVSIINENIKNYPYWAIVNKKYYDDICPFLVMSKTKFYVGQSNLWQGYFFNSGTSDIGTDCAYSNYINGQWQEVKFKSNAGFAIHTDERTTAQPFVIFDYNFSLLFSQDYFLPEYRGKEVTKFKESLQRIKIKRGTDDNVNSYTGDTGELVVNISSKTIHVQDGSTQGGIPLAKKSEVDTLTSRIEEVFQSVSNGKRLIAEAVTDKGIETLATDTFETIRENINNLNAFKFYLGEEEPQNPEEGSMWFPEIDKNEKVNLCFTNTESYIQKVDGTILGTISLKELDRFPLLNISNFMTVRMFNFKHFKGGYGNIIPAYIYNYNKWINVYNFPPFDGTSIKYKIKIDSKFDNLTSYVGYKLSMSNIVQEPIKNSFTINSKIKINNELEIPEIISK